MGRKKVGQEQLCDYIAKNKSRAKKSAEKVEEKLKGKRMVPDPKRKGCYIYVDEENIIHQNPIPVVESDEDFGGLVDPIVQENESHIVGGRDTLEEVENLIGKKLPLENEVVEDMDHIKQM